MSFWATSDGKKVEKQDSIEVEGGGGLPIPAGTQVVAAISEAKFETSDADGTYISLKWDVMKPEQFEGRKVFQKLHVFAADAPVPNRIQGTDAEAKFLDKQRKKGDKAKRMFGVIDTNAGGKHLASTKAPTDDTLQANLCAKPMMLRLDVWEIDTDRETGDKIPKADRPTGNWISKVAPKGEYVKPDSAALDAVIARQKEEHRLALEQAPQQQAASRPAAQRSAPQDTKPGFTDDEFDDDIPF